MVTLETLAAALRVAQHGARTAMLAARTDRTDDLDGREVPEDTNPALPSPGIQRDAAPGSIRQGEPT